MILLLWALRKRTPSQSRWTPMSTSGSWCSPQKRKVYFLCHSSWVPRSLDRQEWFTPPPSKVKAVKDAPTPSNLPKLRAFLGLIIGVGAVLAHQMEDGSTQPICYASRTLSPTEKNHTQHDKRGSFHHFWSDKISTVPLWKIFYLIDWPQTIDLFISSSQISSSDVLSPHSVLVSNFRSPQLRYSLPTRKGSRECW